MKYEQLEKENLSSMTRKELEKWVEDLYSKANSVPKRVSKEEMKNLYVSCDQNRKMIMESFLK
tara:strand:+ start:11336 stop:11524 length:189 start_codon:yes stop_codon:yes gene_type:complete